MAAGVASKLNSEVSLLFALSAIVVVASSGFTSSISAKVTPVPFVQFAVSPAAFGLRWIIAPAPG